jgi:FAD/FMN-containing dehydrogenase
MGGHAFAVNALVLDMRKFNRIAVDAERKIVTVQSGATWHDVQKVLHPTLAIKAMQSTDIFTVGGSISVNAHGMDHRAGSVGRTVTAMRVMLADGTIHTISRSEEPDLFNLVVGGYGLFGIIIDADIEVTDNRVYQSERRIFDYQDFQVAFDGILKDDRYALLYGHLSTAPQSFLREMILYTYKEAAGPGGDIPPLGEVTNVRWRRLVFNVSKHGPLAMRLKWWAEKYVEPRLENCPVSRNQALGEGEGCFVSRNEPMHDSVKYLKNDLKDETDILQEYFVPRDQFVAFVDGLRRISLANNAALLNASVRIVHRENNFLTYAPVDMYAIVLYLNQRTDAPGAAGMETITRQLVDLTVTLGGRFFLPYQLYYTREQLQQSYPEIDAFFSAKRRYDPDGLFTNTFYRTYAP